MKIIHDHVVMECGSLTMGNPFNHESSIFDRHAQAFMLIFFSVPIYSQTYKVRRYMMEGSSMKNDHDIDLLKSTHWLHWTALSALAAATKGRESVCKSVLSLHSLLFWHFLPQKIHKMSVNFFPRWINLNFIYLWFHLCWNYSALRKIKIIELMLANHWIQRSYV